MKVVRPLRKGSRAIKACAIWGRNGLGMSVDCSQSTTDKGSSRRVISAKNGALLEDGDFSEEGALFRADLHQTGEVLRRGWYSGGQLYLSRAVIRGWF